MEQYLTQLLADIAQATENVERPYSGRDGELSFWISDEEEERTAPRRALEEWTGICKVQLPSAERLNDEQIGRLLEALKKMLEAYNWAFVMQIQVPTRIQYNCIRDNFDQTAIVKVHNMGFFELCRPGTPHRSCALGPHCHCRFFKELCDGFIDEELTPEEERARVLEIEVQHIKRKYGDDWRKYYPYHLDPEYDDEYGNPYDYGVSLNNETDAADWWRKGEVDNCE